MTGVYFAGAVILLTLGHLWKTLRWRYFTKVYEDTSLAVLGGALSGGYLINFFIPFHMGDLLRIIVAGRRMKNGYGYSAATVLVDRGLDVLAVSVILGAMSLLTPGETLWKATAGYFLLVAVLAALLAAAFLFNRQCKRLALWVCSLFNDTIKFRLLFFLWSLISSCKDGYRKLSKKKLLFQTAAMWSCYLLSYALAARMVASLEGAFSFQDLFLMLFQSAPLGASTFSLTRGILAPASELMLCLYILIPLPAMLLFCIPAARKEGSAIVRTRRILPQRNRDEQLNFLGAYFACDDRQAIKEYLEMNQDVLILQDYSSGSDATTMLCIRDGRTVFRKYAFGNAADKLYQQALWLKRNADRLPMTHILSENRSQVAYCYDMESSNGVGMFQYIHTHTTQESWAILQAVLEDIRTRLHTPARGPVDPQEISRYIDTKVTGNLETMRKNRTLKALMEYPYLVINGVRYKNLPLLQSMLDKRNLVEIFRQDQQAETHGDLTVENIICTPDGPSPYYLIDPNPAELMSVGNLDYGKLLQSLHGKYEMQKLSPSLEVVDNEIRYFLPDTGEYTRIYQEYHQYLTRSFAPEQVKSIYYHEIIHWLRLMPYQLRRKEETAPRFYAAMILVMNDVERLFEETT